MRGTAPSNQTPTKRPIDPSPLVAPRRRPPSALPLATWGAYCSIVFFSNGILPGPDATQLDVLVPALEAAFRDATSATPADDVLPLQLPLLQLRPNEGGVEASSVA